MPYQSPLLPLDTFRQLIGWNPLNFWQLSSQTYAPITNACSTLVHEHSWQNAGAAGREDIRNAIFEAEKRLVDYLKYSPVEHYKTDVLDTGCLVHNNGSYQSYGQPPFFKLSEGRVSQIATETVTLISDQIPVQFADTDGDGFNETFILTVTDSTTDPTTVEIYFSSNDQLTPYNTSDYLARWQIRPVVVSRTGTNELTVKGNSWLIVQPQKYEGFLDGAGYNNDAFGNRNTTGALDPSQPSNFVSTLGVYKRVVSGANQANLIYTNGDGSETTYTINVTIADRKAGEVALRVSGNNSPCTCGVAYYYPYTQLGSYFQPSYPAYPSVRVEINYRAGETLQDWQTIITRLALAELKQRICACSDANQEIYHWQQDLARAGGVTEEQFRIDTDLLGNPLGTRRGQIYAWQRIAQRRMLRGVRIG